MGARREAGPTWQADLSYWQAQFPGGIPELLLPTDRPRFRSVGHRLGTLTRQISGDAAAMVQHAARKLRVTPFAVMVAAYGYLLHQLSRHDDLVIGVPFAHRSYPGGERVVGNCSTTLPLRSQLLPGARVGEYIAGLQAALVAAHEHPGFSIEALRERIKADGGGGRVFAAGFNLDRASEVLTMRGLRIGVAAAPKRFATSDLSFDVLLVDGAFQLTVKYDADLFDRTTAEEYAALYDHLLGEFAARHEMPLDRISLAPSDVIEALRSRGRGHAAPLEPTTLSSLIELRARQSPAATAVRDGDEELSYAEVNERANRLARHLVELGAGRSASSPWPLPGPRC